MTDIKLFKNIIIIWFVFFLVLGFLAMACDLSDGDIIVDIIEIQPLDCDKDAEEYME